MKKDNFQLGALIDDRPEHEGQKDFHFEEMVSCANPVIWKEKPKSEWRKFPVSDQNGSSSCVAQTIKKLAGVYYWLKYGIWVDFSATSIYQSRLKKPNPGMGGVESFDIWKNEGITLEALARSEQMTDAEMDALGIPEPAREVGKVFRIGNFVILPVKDIETVASVIQTTRKAVMIWTFWNTDEWTAVPEVKYPDLTLENAQGRHSMAAVDYLLYEGEKALLADESWNKTAGFDGQRVIKESFFRVRNWFVAYPINFRFETATIEKPKHSFSQDLKFSDRNSDVKALQDILKYEGLFPINIESTGLYGAITAKAVLAFQRKYKVASEDELSLLLGRSTGPKTREKLNELYG